MADLVGPVPGIVEPLQPLNAPEFLKEFFGGGNKGWIIPSIQQVWEDRLVGPQAMFQDDLGASPVTAIGQSVGLIRDVSGNGIHFSQSDGSRRPTLEARYNLAPSSFDASAWGKEGTGLGVAPTLAASLEDGPHGQLAQQIDFNAVGDTTWDSSVVRLPDFVVKVDETQLVKVWIKAMTAGDVGKKIVISMNGLHEVFTLTSAWQTMAAIQTLFPGGALTVMFGAYGDHEQEAFSILFGGIDVRPASMAIGLPEYQEVTGPGDYKAEGFPAYLKADGLAQVLDSQEVDLSGTQEVSFAVAFSADDMNGGLGWLVNTNESGGSWGLQAPQAAGGGVRMLSNLGGTSHAEVATPYYSRDRLIMQGEEGNPPLAATSGMATDSKFRLFASSAAYVNLFSGKFFAGFWIDRWLTPEQQDEVLTYFKTTLRI